MTERIEPPLAGDERATLTTFLDYQRATVHRKVLGCPEEHLRTSPVASGTSVLGLVRHLAYVERWWFQDRFAARDVTYPWTDAEPDADFRVPPEETVESALARYDRDCAAAREITAAADLDAVAARGKGVSLRWILVHLIEETARHNGHLDFLRELADGAVGE